MDLLLPFERPDIVAYSALLAESYARWKKQPLVDSTHVRALCLMPRLRWYLTALSQTHFCYANQTALTLWGMTWMNLRHMPPVFGRTIVAAERQRLLDEAARQGYVDNYEASVSPKTAGDLSSAIQFYGT